MAKRTQRVLDREQTAHFIVYNRRTGNILAVHHLSAFSGVRAPSDRVIERRVLGCAAEALNCATGELRLLATPEATSVSPGMRVDPVTGKLQYPQRLRRVEARDKETIGQQADLQAKLTPP